MFSMKQIQIRTQFSSAKNPFRLSDRSGLKDFIYGEMLAALQPLFILKNKINCYDCNHGSWGHRDQQLHVSIRVVTLNQSVRFCINFEFKRSKQLRKRNNFIGRNKIYIREKNERCVQMNKTYPIFVSDVADWGQYDLFGRFRNRNSSLSFPFSTNVAVVTLQLPLNVLYLCTVVIGIQNLHLFFRDGAFLS